MVATQSLLVEGSLESEGSLLARVISDLKRGNGIKRSIFDAKSV